MPNHVTSEMIFRGVSAAEQDAILSAVCNSEAKVDFSVLVPEPLNMWQGNEGVAHEKAFGKRLGMVWARENWGTKWNAYQSRPINRSGDTLTIVFDTAWSPPYPWLAAVFNNFRRSFEHNWFDEGANWSVHGEFDFSTGAMGPRWSETRADRETHERLHTLKWGVAGFDDEGAA